VPSLSRRVPTRRRTQPDGSHPVQETVIGRQSCNDLIQRERGALGRSTVTRVSFLTRLLIARSVRRAMHPGRAVKRAVTPRSIKRVRHAMHPLSNAIYDVERSLNTKQRRSNSRSPAYHHGTCTVNHRSAEAAAKCRRTT
jgi:hypothetical protein